MQHTLILQDAELTLRPLQESDFAALCALAGCHAQELQWLGTPPNTPAYYRAALESPTQQPFVVEVGGKLAGCTRYGDINPQRGSLEIGWTWLDPQYYGAGINRRMKCLLLDYAFGPLNMERVQLCTDILNTRSQRAIEKLGARREGVLRHTQRRIDGSWRDTVYYSILREEWQAAQP